MRQTTKPSPMSVGHDRLIPGVKRAQQSPSTAEDVVGETDDMAIGHRNRPHLDQRGQSAIWIT